MGDDLKEDIIIILGKLMGCDTGSVVIVETILAIEEKVVKMDEMERMWICLLNVFHKEG